MLDKTGDNGLSELLGETPTTQRRAPMTLEWLPLSVMFRDPTVNPRAPEKRLSHLKKIAAKFDWNSVRPFTLSKRGPEQYAIVNGAGTKEMILRYKPEFADYLYPCIIINQGKSRKSEERTKVEAVAFGHQGLDAKLQPAQYFHVAAARGVDWVRDIQNSLAANSFTTAEGGKWPHSVPLPVVLPLYTFDNDRSDLLLKVLRLCRAIWPQYQIKAVHFMGLAIVLSTYGVNVKEDRLRHIMSEMNPIKVIEDLTKNGGAYTHVYASAFGFANKLVDAYDKKYGGALIGGARKGTRYVPNRASLEATFDEILTVWKNAAKKAKDAAIE